MKASATAKLAVERLLPELQKSAARVQRQNFYTLGLDVSSSFTGFAVLAPEGQLVKCGAVDLRKCSTILEAATVVERELATLKTTVASGTDVHFKNGSLQEPRTAVPWHVGIEDFMKSFGRASFHTQGLFKLAQLNGIVSFQCKKTFLDDGPSSGTVVKSQAEPRLFMPNAIRAFHGLKAPKKPRSKKQAASSKSKGSEALGTSTQKKNAKTKDIKRIVWERAAEELPESLWTYGVRGGFQPSNYDIADAYFTAKFMLKTILEETMLEDDCLLDAVQSTTDVQPSDIIDSFLADGHHLKQV